MGIIRRASKAADLRHHIIVSQGWFTSNSKSVIASISPEDGARDPTDSLLNDGEDLAIERALGVPWCVESDTLEFRIYVKDKHRSRRSILSTGGSVSDPLDCSCHPGGQENSTRAEPR